MLVLTLKGGREIATRRRHPWLFSGAVARQTGAVARQTGAPQPPGAAVSGPVEGRDAQGEFLARGFSSPASPIVARWWRFDEGPLDQAFVAGRVAAAVDLRRRVVPPETDGYRLINAEGDWLPGLVVDRYGPVLVVQATTAGTEAARPLWQPALASLEPEVIIQRNDLPSREGEGLETADRLLAGSSFPERVPFREHGLRFLADVAEGQKTGFFLDQRESRALVRGLAGGRRVLNLFSYSGAFGVAALAGGASRVVHVDSSAPALELAREHHRLNGQGLETVETVCADAFEDLRRRVAAGETWDVVITDPPAFAKRREDVDRACRGYKDINRLAVKLLAPGGTLVACSCSGPVDVDLFQKVLFAASLDAGVSLRLLGRRGAGPDHPVSLDCPEGDYLKVFHLER